MLHYVKVTYCAVERNRTAQSGLESQILITIHGLSLADFHKPASLHNPNFDFLVIQTNTFCRRAVSESLS